MSSSKYRHLFFDLDRTLWDFERNSRETLFEMFQENQLGAKLNSDFEQFFQVFREENKKLWHVYRSGEKSKDDLRVERFTNTLFHFNHGDWKLARVMSAQYLEVCPEKPHLKEHSIEILHYLTLKYKIHLITNGFTETQKRKIKATGIDQFLDQVIISEEINLRKPQAEIFEFAIEKAKAEKEGSIMIGDDWKHDIKGAKDFGMDQIHFGEVNESHDFKPTFRISTLKELKGIL